MGCAQSSTKKRGSAATIDSLESNDAKYARIKQRDGHPSFYKTDGYTIGLRVKVRSNMQTVYIATARSSGDKVTMKEYHLANCEESQVVEELMMLSQFTHESLPKLREIFITNFSVYAIINYIDTLRLTAYLDMSRKQSTLSITDTRTIFMSVLTGIHHCHSHKVIIRNIVPSNIMVKKVSSNIDGKVVYSYEVKIVDFSQAVEFGSMKYLYDHPLFDWADVPYMAPEALLGHPYTCTMDIWSAAVMLFAMLSGELPFESNDDKILVDKIKNAQFTYGEKWQNLEESAVDLIDHCLVNPESQRYRTIDLLTHPWIQGKL